jgi:hypothetical protein
MSPTADRKMQSMDAQMYLVANPSEYGSLSVSSTARIKKKMDNVPNMAFVSVM